MPRYSQDQTNMHRARVKRIMVIKPEASSLDIQKELKKEKNPITLTQHYILKLKNSIIEERKTRFDSYTVNGVLAKFQDDLNQMSDVLWDIVNDEKSTRQEKTQALRELRNNGNVFFERMFNAGVFEKKLGELNVQDQSKLDELKNATQEERRLYYQKIREAENILRSGKGA